MERMEDMNDVLNDLIKINNDRIAEYQLAMNEAGDKDMSYKSLFEQMIAESTQNKDELASVIEKNEGIIEDETTTSGKIYRAWMEIKGTFTDVDKTTILDSCHFSEDATQRAYDAALETGRVPDEKVKNMLVAQQEKLKQSKDLIKEHLDAHTTLKNLS